MKKIIYAIAALAVMMTSFTACEKIEDDIFEKDPATRQDEWMADYRRVFNNNEYGWALYTSQPTYGRHPSVANFAVRFDQEYCTFYRSSATNSIPAAMGQDSCRSTYCFKMDNGIVLSFDTYNTFFHYYADQSQYFAQEQQADFEFCLDRYSANEDTIFGHSKTKGLPFMMVKMKMKAEEFQEASDKVANYAAYNCVMMCAGDTLRASFYSGYHNLLVYFPDEEGGPDVEHMYSYGQLTDGIYFMENFHYKGHTVVEMKLDFESGEYTDINGNAKIGPKPFSDYLLKSNDYDSWFFGYSGLGGWTQGEWDKARTKLDGSSFHSSNLHYIGLMPYGDEQHIDLVFNMWFGADEVHYPMEIKKLSDTKIALRWTGEEKSGRNYSFYDLGFAPIVDAMASTGEWKEYNITFKAGNPMMPQGFILADASNPDNSYYFEPNFRYYHYSIWE